MFSIHFLSALFSYYCVYITAVIGQDPNESFYARIPGGQKGILLLPNNLDHGSYPNPATSKSAYSSVLYISSLGIYIV